VGEVLRAESRVEEARSRAPSRGSGIAQERV
jgi:hypothetical protein